MFGGDRGGLAVILGGPRVIWGGSGVTLWGAEGTAIPRRGGGGSEMAPGREARAGGGGRGAAVRGCPRQGGCPRPAHGGDGAEGGVGESRAVSGQFVQREQPAVGGGEDEEWVPPARRRAPVGAPRTLRGHWGSRERRETKHTLFRPQKKGCSRFGSRGGGLVGGGHPWVLRPVWGKGCGWGGGG